MPLSDTGTNGVAAFARVDQGCGGILLQGNRLKTNNNSGAFARLYRGAVDLYLNANCVRRNGHASTALVLVSAPSPPAPSRPAATRPGA